MRLTDDGGYTMTPLLVTLGVIAIASAIVVLSVLTVLATGYRFRRGTCAGVVWADAQTDTNGLMRVSGSPTLSSTASPLFTPLGNAPQTGTLTVAAGNGRRTVTVTASGRVTIP